MLASLTFLSMPLAVLLFMSCAPALFNAADAILLEVGVGLDAELGAGVFRTGVLDADGITDGRLRRGESDELDFDDAPASFEVDEDTLRDVAEVVGGAAADLGLAALLEDAAEPGSGAPASGAITAARDRLCACRPAPK